jgi:hypothetical protein
MHLLNQHFLLIAVGSLSFAALIFFLVYILYEDANDKAPRTVSVALDDCQGAYEDYAAESINVRPSFISRAIGDTNQRKLQRVRSFRAANLLFAALPTALLLHRERVSDQLRAAAIATSAPIVH